MLNFDPLGVPAALEDGKPMSYVKVEGPAMKATGNEVAIESIEIAHEGLTIENE